MLTVDTNFCMPLILILFKLIKLSVVVDENCGYLCYYIVVVVISNRRFGKICHSQPQMSWPLKMGHEFYERYFKMEPRVCSESSVKNWN